MGPWLLAMAAALVVVLFLLADRRADGRRERAGRTPTGAGVVGQVEVPDGNEDSFSGSRENETAEQRRIRMMRHDMDHRDFKLSEQDIYLYVQAKGSNALSLVAAFESSRDKDYLKTAVEKFPNDPFVLSKALMWLEPSDTEQTAWLDAFKANAPTNALANFLAAKEAMTRGDRQAALAEIMAAKDKGYDEYFRQSSQGLVDAYSSAGRTLGDAELLGNSEITLPHLAQLKGLGRRFIEFAEKAAADGDTKTQQEMLMVNWLIGEKMRAKGESVPIITELVGIAMQNTTLRAWPADAEFAGRTTAEALAENAAGRAELRGSAQWMERWYPTAPEDEIITYMGLVRNSGERHAFVWLKEQHPEFAPVQRTSN